MAKQKQWRGGDSAATAAFTGAVREVSVNTTTNRIHVHDGATAGGHAAAKLSEVVVVGATSITGVAGDQSISITSGTGIALGANGGPTSGQYIRVLPSHSLVMASDGTIVEVSDGGQYARMRTSNASYEVSASNASGVKIVAGTGGQKVIVDAAVGEIYVGSVAHGTAMRVQDETVELVNGDNSCRILAHNTSGFVVVAGTCSVGLTSDGLHLGANSDADSINIDHASAEFKVIANGPANLEVTFSRDDGILFKHNSIELLKVTTDAGLRMVNESVYIWRNTTSSLDVAFLAINDDGPPAGVGYPDLDVGWLAVHTAGSDPRLSLYRDAEWKPLAFGSAYGTESLGSETIDGGTGTVGVTNELGRPMLFTCTVYEHHIATDAEFVINPNWLGVPPITSSDLGHGKWVSKQLVFVVPPGEFIDFSVTSNGTDYTEMSIEYAWSNVCY